MYSRCISVSNKAQERNFLRDQSGMRSQLLALDQLVQLMDPQLYLHLQSADSTNFFFFFRMLLVWYKREFEWGDTLRLWETLWTDYFSSSFHLFIALAILEKHRDVIMDHLKHFDEVLKYSKSSPHSLHVLSDSLRAKKSQSTNCRTQWNSSPSSPAPSHSSIASSALSKPSTRKTISPLLRLPTSADQEQAAQTLLSRAKENHPSIPLWGLAAASTPLPHSSRQ